MVWREGCLAVGLVRGAVRHYCLGGCSAPVVCARRSRLVLGGRGRCRVLCLPRFHLPAPRLLRCVWQAVPSGCPLSSLAGTPFPSGLCVPPTESGRPSGFPHVSFVFVCARALAASAPLPLPGLVWRTLPGRSRCWALVGPFHAVRAPPRVLPRSRAPFGLLGGGASGPFSSYLAWGCALPVGWVQAWGPVTNPTARALASWVCTLWGRQEGAWEGRLLPEGSAYGVGRSPTPDHSSFWACGRGPLPTGCVCGGCGFGDPSRTPQRALFRAGFARCGGGTRAPLGGAPSAWASEIGRSPSPDRPSFGACGRGPLPTGCGCGGCGCGDPSPTPQRALLRAGFACCGGRTRAPRGGRLLPGCGASGVGRSPSPDRPFFGACGRGPLPTGCGCGGCGLGD